MQTLTENERQRWDIDAHGRVNDGQNDCFDGGLALLVNGAQFHGQNNQMTADGSEFVLSSPIGNVVVTLPSLVPGAFVNGRKVVTLVREAIQPTRRPLALGEAAGHVEIGHVTEHTDDFKWMNWSQLLESFPAIER